MGRYADDLFGGFQQGGNRGKHALHNFIFALAAFKAEMNIFSVKIPPVFIFFGQDNVFMVLAFIDAEIALDQVIIDNNGNMKFTADNFSRLQGTLQRLE